MDTKHCEPYAPSSPVQNGTDAQEDLSHLILKRNMSREFIRSTGDANKIGMQDVPPGPLIAQTVKGPFDARRNKQACSLRRMRNVSPTAQRMSHRVRFSLAANTPCSDRITRTQTKPGEPSAQPLHVQGGTDAIGDPILDRNESLELLSSIREADTIGTQNVPPGPLIAHLIKSSCAAHAGK